MKKMLWTFVAVLVCVLAVQVGTVEAVGADQTGLGFDQQGAAIVGTARNVVAPVIVIMAIVFLAGLIIFVGRAAGFAVRTIVGCTILAIAITGAGLTTFFPGLITSVTFP